MEILRKYLTLEEKNQKVKLIVDTLLKKDDLSGLFSDSDDPYLLSKIGKTCLLQWNRILEKYESILNTESHNHFNDFLQVRIFEESVKSKIIFIFRILIYIMRNTYNHELYIIDATHANFLYSRDLDVSFHSFLFHNEFYTDITHSHNVMTVDYFKSLDLSFFTKKVYEISLDFENDVINIDCTYKENNIMDFQNEIQNNVRNNVLKDPMSKPYEFNFEYSNGLCIYSQIFIYQTHKNSEFQKLLSIEILANLLYLKIHSKIKLELILYSIFFFYTNSLEDCLLDSLSILSRNIFLIAKYHTETEETLFYRNILKYMKVKLQSYSIIHQNEIYLWIKNRFSVLLNYLDKDLTNKEILSNLFLNTETKNIFLNICYVLYDQSLFIDFMNNFISNNTFQILKDFYGKILSEDPNSDIKDVSEIYYRNHEDYNQIKIFFYQIFAKIIIYFTDNSHLNEDSKLLYPFYEYLYKFTEDFSLYNSSFVDHIFEIILGIFSHNGNNKILYFHFPIFENLLKYYFNDARKNTSVLSIRNILSLIKLKASAYLFYKDLLYLENIIDMSFKNPEFSLYLLLFPSEKSTMHNFIENYLDYQKMYIFDLDMLIDHLNDMDTISNVDMYVFLNFKKLQPPLFMAKYLDFLKSINENNMIEACNCYSLHYGHVLRFVEIILSTKNLKLKFKKEFDIYSAIKIHDNHYCSTDVTILLKINYLILKKLDNLSENFLISESVYRFVLNIEFAITFSPSYFDKSSPDFYKHTYKTCVFLRHVEENLKYLYCIENNALKYEKIKRIIDLVSFIYKRLFFSSSIPIIPRISGVISIEALDNKFNVIINSSMDFISSVLEINYLSILNLLLRFDNFSILRLPAGNKESIGFVYFIYKMSFDMVTTDPNLISLYCRYVSQTIEILYQYEYTELIDILQILIKHAVKYNSTYKIDSKIVKEEVLKILSSMATKINMFEEKVLYKFLDLISEFIDKNIAIFTLEDIVGFINEITLSSDKFEKIISDLKLFPKFLDLIAKFDKNYINSLQNSLNILENSYVYSFLNDSFLNLSYVEFFIEAQKNQDWIFLFIHKHVNLITNPRLFFNKNASKIDNYLKILRCNIETNISNNKSIEYKKSSLFLLNLDTDFKEEADVFSYLISLVRLSNYSNIISKSEIFRYFNILTVLRFVETKCKNNSENKDLILQYAYTYVICLFEDEFYLISSLIYVVHCYDNLPSNFLDYLNQKFIYTPKIQTKDNSYSDLIKEDDINLKTEILNSMIGILNQEVYFYKIIALQFLSEIIATFPSLLCIIKNDIIKFLICRLEFTNLVGIEFTRSNCSAWGLDFRFGYFITVSLYRGSLSYTKETIETICFTLKESNVNRSINFMALIYQILASEICCCKYIQYLNMKHPDFYDKNCKIKFEKRKHEIFNIFLSYDILNILLLKSKEIYLEKVFRSTFRNIFIDLWNSFFEFIKNGKITIHKKYLIGCLFQFYVPNSHDILFPASLIKCRKMKISSVKISSKSNSQVFTKINRKRLFKIKMVSFGFISKYHHEVSNSNEYNCIEFFYSKIKSSDNFYAVNLNEIETIMINSTTKNCKNDKIDDSLKRKLEIYNLPADVYKVINSKLFLKEDTSDLNIACNPNNEIFTFDAIMSDKYLNALFDTKLNDKIESVEYFSTILHGNFCKETKVFEGLIFLCTFSSAKDYIEVIGTIKNTLCEYSNQECLERLLENINQEILKVESKKEDLTHSVRLKGFKQIIIFFIKNKLSVKEDLLVELFFFELFLAEEKERYFSDIFFRSSDITQEFLNWIQHMQDNKKKNIVFETLNCPKRNSKCILGALLNIFSVYLEKMKLFFVAKYFNSNLDFSNLKKNFFGKELDSFFNLLNQINFTEISDKMKIIFNFFNFIKKNTLNSYFINSFDCENEMFVFLFEVYTKIIEKCCQIYSITRKTVFHDNRLLKESEKYFISGDFICFLFRIDQFETNIQKILQKNKNKAEKLISFFYRIRNISPDFIQIFFNLKCLSLKTKLLIIIKRHEDFNLIFDKEFLLQIDRNNIIESIINSFENLSNEIFVQRNWKVRYLNEEGQGIGLLHELFIIFGKCIDEIDYFAPFKSPEFVSISVSSPEEQNKIEKIYYFTGVIMAKSIHMNSVIGIEFINSFYLPFIQETFKIEDLKDIDSEFYTNIISLRDVEDLDSLCLTFDISVKVGQEIVSQDLIENGSTIKVTKENLEKYIKKMTEFKIFKGMKVFLEKLKEGFRLVFNHCFFNLFTHLELKMILEGEKNINLDEWKAETRYEGNFYSDHKIIVWFWNFVERSDEITRRKLMFFITGLEYLPVGGFKSSKFVDNSFTIASNDIKNAFPTSQTCSNLLILPSYEDENIFIDRIQHAIEARNYGSI